MNRRYEDSEYPFEDIDEIDEDGFTNYYDIEDLYNTEFMQTNKVFPPKVSFHKYLLMNLHFLVQK